MFEVNRVCVCCAGSVVGVSNNRNRAAAAAASAHFPSVCWLFGKKLHARLRRPIGLVSVTYSDSFVDEWLPSHVIDKCDVKYTDRFVVVDDMVTGKAVIPR